jgi:hypothetical protein
MFTRRGLIGAAAVLAGADAVSSRAQAARIPEAPTTTTSTMQPPLVPTSGPDYQPVVTLNGWTLPWRLNGDWKEFHLVAEPVVREIAPGMKAHLWGYNGQSPGPTMAEMEMPLPDNTLPMMTGTGQFGTMGLGGMVSVVMVREGLAANEYKNPGWYKHPAGSVAYRIDRQDSSPPRQSENATTPKQGVDVQVVKPVLHRH